MKKIIISCLVLLLFSCTKSQECSNTEIKNGYLDLRNYNFSKSGSIYLDGIWKFKWMNRKKSEYIKVPSHWNKNKYSGNGYGWYTLIIIHNKKEKLGLHLERSQSSYEMYINDKLLLSNGKPGNTKKETIPATHPRFVELPNESPLIIKWKISNFHHNEGGANYTPLIGLYHNLEYMHDFSNLIDSIIIGAILAMFFHYLILFLRKKNEKAHLYFSLLCLFIFARTLASKHYFHTLFPADSVLIFQLSNKIDYLCVALSAICLIILFKELLPNYFNKKVTTVCIIAWATYALYVLVTPMTTYQQLQLIIEIFIISSIMFVIKSIIQSIYYGDKRFIFTLIGSSMLLAAVINDVLIFNNYIISLHLTHLGLFFFILSNSVLISGNFAKAFRKAEYLTINLEKEVKKSTQIIEDQKNELQEIYNNKTSYFVNIAHEIRTPLTLIKNYMDKYIEQVGNEENLIIIKNNIDMLVKNITNIFNLQSIELGKIIFNHDTVVEVTKHVHDKAMLFKSLAENKRIILSTEIPEERAYTKIDSVAFDNIVNNLIENAIKYTTEFEEIKIKVAAEDNIKITVFNSGSCISECQLKSIYKPYYQINHEKKNIQGIGLGLSIVKKIIDDVDGEINVWSEPGKGTEFSVQFNRIIPTDKEAESADLCKSTLPEKYVAASLKPNKYLTERNTILIIEDNYEMLSYLQSIFYDAHNVFCAVNGADALNQLNYIPRPDLIISDIMMDNIDGLEFYNQINKLDNFKNIPLIFLTAKVGHENKLEGLKSGAIDFISKPFDKSELLCKVSSVLNIGQNSIGNINCAEQRKLELDNLFIEYGISKRQIEIITLLKEGLGRKEIAYELGITINTVKTQLQRIFEKCSVSNKTELIKIFNK